MSTAHRPTWAPAIGGSEQGGNREYVPSVQQSALNLPAHTKLKFRQTGQGSEEELREKDLRAELTERETKHFLNLKSEKDFKALQERDLKLLESQMTLNNGNTTLIPKAIDADDEDSDLDSDDDDFDSNEEDEEALLLAELEKIKKERAIEAEKKAQQEALEQKREEEERIKRSNPLMAAQFGINDQDDDFNVKRRWDDDVVFKNQARGEPKVQKRFINDTIRNDFHKRFLTRYFR
eukprot:TRINITY_DN2684_c0_g1_i1.p2 TRINITY_DN2684_c0_g1~~TRINITY_DN2684_c0_g1_i1.p2  ORF type:complete len:236 (-),score=56.16 TRINITY_DN2684_c0_g1_i1:703-1410(-)